MPLKAFVGGTFCVPALPIPFTAVRPSAGDFLSGVVLLRHNRYRVLDCIPAIRAISGALPSFIGGEEIHAPWPSLTIDSRT